MAIRPPKHHSQGFTLVEMLTVVSIVGIIMGFAVPSLLSLNKPLRDGSSQFKSHLSLIRSKAISSGNSAYRLKPRYLTRADYSNGIPHKFVVEYAANCTAPENTTTVLSWQAASQLDLDLPSDVGITDVASSTFGTPSGTITVANDLNWSICFNNRGLVDSGSRKQIVLKDFKGFNKAEIAVFDISSVGGIDMFTYTKNSTTDYPVNTDLNDGQTPSPNPVF